MKRAHEICKLAVYAAVLVFLGALTAATIEIRSDARQLAPRAGAALQSVASIEKSTSDVEQATYATEGELANLADSLNEIAQGLSSHEASELQQAQDASTKLTMLLDQADVDVLAFGLTEQAATLAINGVAADSHATLGAAQTAINQVALQASNPAIADSLRDIRDSASNVKDSTAQIAATSVQLTATATDAREIADHYRALVLAPANKAKTAALFVATLVGRVLGL